MAKYKIKFNIWKSSIDYGYIRSLVVDAGELESLPPQKECEATVVANSPEEAKQLIKKTFPDSDIKTCI